MRNLYLRAPFSEWMQVIIFHVILKCNKSDAKILTYELFTLSIFCTNLA